MSSKPQILFDWKTSSARNGLRNSVTSSHPRIHLSLYAAGLFQIRFKCVLFLPQCWMNTSLIFLLFQLSPKKHSLSHPTYRWGRGAPGDMAHHTEARLQILLLRTLHPSSIQVCCACISDTESIMIFSHSIKRVKIRRWSRRVDRSGSPVFCMDQGYGSACGFRVWIRLYILTRSRTYKLPT